MTKFIALALLLFTTLPTLHAQPPSPPASWIDGYVFANNIRIHYWRTGGEDKPKLIMLHGSSDNGLCWTNLAKELTDDFDIILPDARGHGYSDPPSKSDPADAQAEDIAGLIRALKLDKPIVMGHSMGAASAMWFAAKYPAMPAAVVLEDPRLTSGPAAPSRPTDPDELERRRQAILVRNNMSFDELVADQLEKNPQWGRTEIEFWAPSKRLHHPNTAYVSRSGRPSTSELFAKITAPTLILKADAQGDERKHNDEVAAILPRGEIIHIEGAKHNVRRDQKERLLAALRPFLAAHSTRAK